MNRSSDLRFETVFLVFSSQPVRTFTSASNSGTYGLMSRSGVPSRMSTFLMCRTPSSILSSWTIESPIGFGRLGARVANRPLGSESMKGTTWRLNPWLRWKWYSRMIWENPSRSLSPAWYSSKTWTVPFTPAAPAGWIGMPFSTMKGVWIIPMGFNSVIFSSRELVLYDLNFLTNTSFKDA